MIEKYFNTEGANIAGESYVLDPLKRIDISEIATLIRRKKYFVMHAPRQSGKTTCLLALRDYLNEKGEVYAVYANIEAGQALRNDVDSVIKGVVQAIASRATLVLKNNIAEVLCRQLVNTIESSHLLTEFLSQLCRQADLPLVLIIDEIDALVGDSIVSVLRQIRAGYDMRPEAYPVSVILCGVRDVRDYRIHTGNGEIITGGSAFNIKAESLRLGNFTREDIRTLYEQHTAETGQVFAEDVYPVVWRATEGQPWLVNAMARTATWDMRENRDRTVQITADMMHHAMEMIIYKRETHIDSLADKLKEERVRRVIAPIIAGEDADTLSAINDDDVQYCEDLGLIVAKPELRIANDIYLEVIPRQLTYVRQITMLEQPNWYTRPDNTIDMCRLLENFQQFYRQNIESWNKVNAYKEAGPQLLLQAFLQRIVNGGGYISREYGLGRQRTDILVTKPLLEGYAGIGGPKQYIVLELKIKYGSMEKVIEDGLKQTAAYMDKCTRPELREGHLIIFNTDKIIISNGIRRSITWDDKVFHRERDFGAYHIHIWGL
ncbi:MAG: ATP-binding protein [Bacteroidales bacterium]|nr:ATP-binding protein [Bacteroidales bacterium]